MEKKKIKTKWSKADADNLQRLFKHVGPMFQEQQDFIYWALKEYIDKNHWKPIAGCNCQLSYAIAFNKLRDWFSKNSHQFANE